MLTNESICRRKLKATEQKAYIEAVKCLQSRPSVSDPALVPGARTRYDDFHAVHITHSKGLIEGTGGIHFVVRYTSSFHPYPPKTQANHVGFTLTFGLMSRAIFFRGIGIS